ncbi:hypothetical protein [Thermococcus sp.]|nr:hypothetical protein [Thermococcus sp.]
MRRRYLLSSVLIILLVVGIVEWYGESNSIFLLKALSFRAGMQ